MLKHLCINSGELLNSRAYTPTNPSRTFSIVPIEPNEAFLLDSGAGISVTSNASILYNLQPCTLKVGCAKENTEVKITHVGILEMKLHCGIINVLGYYSPDVTNTLISTEDVRLAGCDICLLSNGPIFL